MFTGSLPQIQNDPVYSQMRAVMEAISNFEATCINGLTGTNELAKDN